MDPVDGIRQITPDQYAASPQPTAALLLAAFAAAATLATSGNNIAGAAASESDGGDCPAACWLDGLNASLRSDPEG
jgi:hypothetical protein